MLILLLLVPIVDFFLLVGRPRRATANFLKHLDLKRLISFSAAELVFNLILVFSTTFLLIRGEYLLFSISYALNFLGLLVLLIMNYHSTLSTIFKPTINFGPLVIAYKYELSEDELTHYTTIVLVAILWPIFRFIVVKPGLNNYT